MNKLKQIIKQITDNDLNTTPGLTTINYLFELIGLKDKVDLRKFSRNFIKIDELIKNTNNEKEDKIIKNDAFNKNFGTNKGEILEGHRMAQILGVEDFGGDVQISGVKKVGYSYWCTANKEMYKCKVENSLNYIDGAYFDAFSNAALLGKLQNLSIFKTNVLTPVLTASSDPNAKVGDVYLAVATSGGEKEIFDSKIIIIPSSRLITSCKMNIFQGTVNVTYDGTIWRWNREGTDAEGEIKVYKLHLFL